MALSGQDLERLADDQYKDRIITGSVYCGSCGYNLRTLPYIYTCPECGNQYNARPLKMTGIFTPHETYFPASEIAAALLCAPIAFVLIRGGIITADSGRVTLGALFCMIMVSFAVQAYMRLVRFIKARALARRIALEEFEE